MTGHQPAPDIRLCFFGDSFTVGVGDPLGAGWVVPVVAAAPVAGHALTAYNLGIRRDTSLDISRRWALEARERLKDGDRYGVVFAFGVNDVDSREGGRRVPRERSLGILSELLDGVAAAGWSALVVGPPPVDDAQHSERAADLAAGIADACAGRGVPFVDVATALADDCVWRSEVAAGDAFHPSTRGYARMAAVIEPPLLRWVGRLAQQSVAGGDPARPDAPLR